MTKINFNNIHIAIVIYILQHYSLIKSYSKAKKGRKLQYSFNMFPMICSLQLYLRSTSIIAQIKLWQKYISKYPIANLGNIHIRSCVPNYILVIYFTVAK